MDSPHLSSQSNSQLLVKRNIPKLYAFSFFQTFLVVIPVVVPFWQSKGLSLQDIFLLQGLFGASLLVFDAPAGYLADMYGRRRALVIGSVISAIAYQVFWFGDSFFDFAVYEILVGLGLSLQSGCDVAILYGTLEHGNQSSGQGRFLGRRMTAMNLGEGVAALLGGWLAGYSLQLPAYANAITAWIPCVLAWLLVEPSRALLPRESHFKNFRSIGQGLFGHSRLLTLVFANFIFYGFATYCAVWSLQPYWSARGVNISYFGYLWAANCFLTAIVSRFAHAIEQRIGSITSIALIALLPIIGYFGMGLAGGLWGLLFTASFSMCRGLNAVLFQDAINTRVPSEMRATANSIGSLGMRALFLFFGPVLGGLLDQHGPDFVMQSLGVVYAVGFFVIALPLLSQHRHFRASG